MEKIARKTLLIVLVLIFSSGCSSAEEGVPDSEYKELDYKQFNDSLMSGKMQYQDWMSDPVAVSLRFIGPFEGLKQTIRRTNPFAENPDNTEVVIINDGLLDDSVSAVMYKLRLKKEGSRWIFNSAGHLIRCQQGRGHTEFSPEPCK